MLFGMVRMVETIYVYIFRGKILINGHTRKGQMCRLITRTDVYLVLIEFADGERAVVNRNAIRRV